MPLLALPRECAYSNFKGGGFFLAFVLLALAETYRMTADWLARYNERDRMSDWATSGRENIYWRIDSTLYFQWS
jgi:hypothetical protein